MNFSEAVISGFKNYVNFKGRAKQAEFWYFVLAVFILQTITSLVTDPLLQKNLITVFVLTPGNVIYTSQTGANSLPHDAANPIEALVLLVVALPLVAVTVRRLHDTGRKATSLLWFILPVLGHIILAFQLAEPTKAELPAGGEIANTFKRVSARKNWVVAILVVLIVNLIVNIGFVVTQCVDAISAADTYCVTTSVLGSIGQGIFSAASIAAIGYFVYRLARAKD